MNKLFTGFGKKTQSKKEPVIVVSGLPRSGTSMMMKILAEAGVPIVTDELRRADTDNPNGYYELEAVKGMSAGNLAWLAGAGGRAVKVISSLLEYLPDPARQDRGEQHRLHADEFDSAGAVPFRRSRLEIRGQDRDRHVLLALRRPDSGRRRLHRTQPAALDAD